MAHEAAVRVRIEGRVQMVGFRYWALDRAAVLGLDGWLTGIALGIAIGRNWNKMRKAAGPYADLLQGMTAQGYDKSMRVMAEQMERVEDTLAAAKIHRTNGRAVPAKKKRARKGSRKRVKTFPALAGAGA